MDILRKFCEYFNYFYLFFKRVNYFVLKISLPKNDYFGKKNTTDFWFL